MGVDGRSLRKDRVLLCQVLASLPRAKGNQIPPRPGPGFSRARGPAPCDQKVATAYRVRASRRSVLATTDLRRRVYRRSGRGGAGGTRAEVAPFAPGASHKPMPRESSRIAAALGSPRRASRGEEDGEGVGPGVLRKGEGLVPGRGAARGGEKGRWRRSDRETA